MSNNEVVVIVVVIVALEEKHRDTILSLDNVSIGKQFAIRLITYGSKIKLRRFEVILASIIKERKENND